MEAFINDAVLIQGSADWLQARLGHCTASRFKDVLAKIKSGEAAIRKNYKALLVVERLTGTIQESYTNDAMQWGNDNEPQARSMYEFKSDNIVQEVGFIHHPTITWAGCSCDGLIGEDGGLEIKSPYKSAVHIETLLNGVPSEHVAQIQGSMWITGRKWWDFVSFDGRMPANLQIYIKRIERDDKYISDLEAEVIAFLGEVSDLETKLKEIK